MNKFLKSAVLGMGLSFAAVQTAAAITIDLYSGGTTATWTNAGTNSATLTYDLGGGHTLKVTAWYNTSPSTNFVQTRLERYSPGLGVCDPSDFVNGSCSSPQHMVDNNGGKVDYVLFAFDTVVDFASIVLNPVSSSNDTDAKYVIGNVFNSGNYTNLSGFSLNGLGGGTLSEDSNGTHVIRSINLSGQSGSYLLIGAQQGETNDYFKIKRISFNITIPEPTTWALMILAFAGLALARRRRAASV